MLQSGFSDAQNAHQHAAQCIMNTLIQESQEDDENIPQKFNKNHRAMKTTTCQACDHNSVIVTVCWYTVTTAVLKLWLYDYCCVDVVSAVLYWHRNCCDDTECCVDTVTAVVQVDKLEQSEAVRSEEEQKAEDRPIVLGECCGLALAWLPPALLSHSRHYMCCQLLSLLSCCCLVLSVVDSVANFWKLRIFYGACFSHHWLLFLCKYKLFLAFIWLLSISLCVSLCWFSCVLFPRQKNEISDVCRGPFSYVMSAPLEGLDAVAVFLSWCHDWCWL